MFIKMLEYETANPGQDLDDKEAQVFDPEVSTERPNVALHQTEYVARPDGKVEPMAARNSREEKGNSTQGQGRPHSNSASRVQPERSPRRSRDYTYPTTDGAATYLPRTSRDTYRRGPDVESGRYVSRSAGRY